MCGLRRMSEAAGVGEAARPRFAAGGKTHRGAIGAPARPIGDRQAGQDLRAAADEFWHSTPAPLIACFSKRLLDIVSIFNKVKETT